MERRTSGRGRRRRFIWWGLPSLLGGFLLMGHGAGTFTTPAPPLMGYIFVSAGFAGFLAGVGLGYGMRCPACNALQQGSMGGGSYGIDLNPSECARYGARLN